MVSPSKVVLILVVTVSIWICLKMMTIKPSPKPSISPGSRPRPSTSGRPTYVIIQDLDGQQGSGTLCLSTLQCFLASVYQHFYVVEPYLIGSHLQSYTDNKPWLTFSSLFDFKVFNRESRKIGYTEMVSVEEFQRTSSTDYKYTIVVIYGHNSSVAWSTGASGNNVSCFGDEDLPRVPEKYRKRVTTARGKLDAVTASKCMVRMVELPITRARMPNKTRSFVHNFIFDTWSPEDVIVIFPSWPKVYLPVSQPLNGINCLQQHIDSHTFEKSQFQPSPRLIQDAENYEKKFLGNTNSLAIMFRIERIVERYLLEHIQKGPKSIEECFNKVFATKSEMTNTSNFLVTIDIGKRYGSDTFMNNNRIKNITKVMDLSMMMLNELHNSDDWSLEKWENSFVEAAGGETHSGYIAALQRLLASRADCLVLVGGGDFQALAAQDYLEYHKSEPACIHLVCCMLKLDELQRTISNRV